MSQGLKAGNATPLWCTMLRALLLSSSLQMGNFSNSMLAETPLGELVENIDKYLIGGWVEMENEH